MYTNQGELLADERRRALLREAQRDRLTAQVTIGRDGIGDRALLLLAAALAHTAERVRIHYAHRRLARLHAGITSVRCACSAGLGPACANANRS